MWVPIALGRDISNGTTRAVILDGRELVAWRGESGSVQVWEDRCPHRGMRLSYGFVRGDRLNCLYHGWEYGSGAACHRIPAHPGLTVPTTIRANAFATVESGGMVLVDLVSHGETPGLSAAAPVASVAVEADIGTVLQLLNVRPLPAVQAFETSLEGIALTIGWHAAGAGHVLLHAVTHEAGAEPSVLSALHRLRAEAQRRAA